MNHYALLRLLLSVFLLYVAWPLIPTASTNLEFVFWGMWLSFFLLVTGANLATLLEINRSSIMEQDRLRKRDTH